MTASAGPDLTAMINAAQREWHDNAPADWTMIDFRRWPRGFHRSAWVIAGYIGCNPFDVLDYPPTPAARAVNAPLTRQCVVFAIAMTSHVPDPADSVEPLFAWFNAAAREYQDEIAGTIEALGDAEWRLPTSRRSAARRLVKMWEQGGAAAFGDLSASLVNKPAVNERGQNAHARGQPPAECEHGHEGTRAAGEEICMTAKQARIAARIDDAMQPLIRDDKDDIAILTGMSDHMADFKHLIDTAKPGVMDELCQRYAGFYRYAKVLETIAGAIQSGAIKVSK